MGLFRLLLLAAVVALLYWGWRRLTAPRRQAGPRQAGPRQAGPGSEPMVRCTHCGVHLPESRALRDETRWYCGPEHLEADARERERR